MNGSDEPTNPPRILPARRSGTDPYADVDITELPEWWQEAIKEFRSHDLPAYRPPRFEDGVLKYEVVNELEERLNVEIDIIGLNVAHGDDWIVRVDGKAIGTIGRRRSPEGYTVYEMDSDEFVTWITKRP